MAEILVIAAHPDDEVLGCGGVIARHARAGDTVRVVIMAEGVTSRMGAVSIIIRTKNEERWIGHCLSMIFQQDYKDFEVILVDNASTDHTVQVAKRYPLARIVNIALPPGQCAERRYPCLQRALHSVSLSPLRAQRH